MPYNTQEARKKVTDLLDQVFENTETKGDINFCISYLVHKWVIKKLKQVLGADNWKKLKYAILDEGLGIFNSAAKCFFRTVLGPYEDKAMLKNGNISELDEDYYREMRYRMNHE